MWYNPYVVFENNEINVRCRRWWLCALCVFYLNLSMQLRFILKMKRLVYASFKFLTLFTILYR